MLFDRIPEDFQEEIDELSINNRFALERFLREMDQGCRDIEEFRAIAIGLAIRYLELTEEMDCLEEAIYDYDEDVLFRLQDDAYLKTES